MNQYEPVPGDVYDAAISVYVEVVCPGAESVVADWVKRRYPDRHPADVREAAFWALSVAANYGVSREVRG